MSSTTSRSGRSAAASRRVSRRSSSIRIRSGSGTSGSSIACIRRAWGRSARSGAWESRVRSASTAGAKDMAASMSRQCPVAVAKPSSAARETRSLTRAVFPMPASPTTSTSCGCPCAASVIASYSCALSASRPNRRTPPSPPMRSSPDPFSLHTPPACRRDVRSTWGELPRLVLGSDAPLAAQPLHADLVLGVVRVAEEAGHEILDLAAHERDRDLDGQVDLLHDVVAGLGEGDGPGHLARLARDGHVHVGGRRRAPRLLLDEPDLVADQPFRERRDAVGAVRLLE